MSSTPVPKSDVDVPSARQLANRNSLRSSSLRRSDSFGADAVAADEMIMRDDDDPANSSARLSAALATEREETRIRLSRELEAEEESPIVADAAGDEDGGDGDGGDDGEAPAQGEPMMMMSLMDLLEETDRQAGIQGPTYRFDEEEEAEEEEEEEEEVKEGGTEVACCVCMVKHKGAPLVPCGHTYCRMCSREMWVQKGHCPVCSNFVMEILEIF